MSIVSEFAIAILLGCAFAVGLLLAGTRVPRWAAPTLSQRIAPYVRDIADPRGLTPLALPSWTAGWRTQRDRFLGMVGGAEATARRLRQAGSPMDVSTFRARQLVWALVGVAAGGLIVVALALAGRMSPAVALVPPILGVVAVVISDALLSSRAKGRMARIEEELPTVLEFLALCLAAGEGLLDALRRVGEVGAGELTGEIRRAVLATGTGSSLAEALSKLSTDLDVPAVSRCADHLIAAIERGAPLAQVLQAQAADAREEAKRTLIEQAGRKEIYMLIPLVFLILPLSVLFAIFPGIVILRLGLG